MEAVKKTSMSKLEKEVKANSLLLEKTLPQMVKKHKNQYVAFYKGEQYFSANLTESLKLGMEKFGENSGFVVRKVSTEPMIFSSLVVL